MATLYILGAGCSRNYNQSISSVVGIRPPLNSDFFKIAKKVIDHYDMSFMFGPIPGLDHFTRNINRIYGYGHSTEDTTAYEDDRLNLEEVLTHFYLEYEMFDKDIPFFNRSSRIQTLLELIAYVITESTRGPICNKHNILSSKINNGDIIWNFNYDTLMDNSLYYKNKFNEAGYKIRFNYILEQ